MQPGRIIQIMFCWVLTLLAISCQKDPDIIGKGTIQIQFIPTMDGKPFEVNQLFQGPNGKRMKIEDFRFYIDEIRFDGQAGASVRKDVSLIDFSKNQQSILITAPVGIYHNLKFGIGVNKLLNGIGIPDFNPASYPMSHPLSIYNGMYWTNQTGYVFMRIEGKTDTSSTQDKSADYSWFYHVGTDTLYEYCHFEKTTWKVWADKTTLVRIGIEVNDLFRNEKDTIDMVKEPFTHTTDQFELASRVISNMRKNIRIIEN